MQVVAIHKDGTESPIWVDEASKQETIDLVSGWYDAGWINGWVLRENVLYIENVSYL